MSDCVYYLHSTIELPLEDVHEYFDDPDLPEEVEDIEITRRNNTLIIRAVAPEGTVGKYTPTAQIKGTVTETRVPDLDAPLPEGLIRDEDGVVTTSDGGPAWTAEAEVEEPTKLIEVAAFKGDREAILQNTALQYPMFEVLCEVAKRADTGVLSAIVAEDGELRAHRIVDGEERPAKVEIVEERSSSQPGGGVDWRDNKYIS